MRVLSESEVIANHMEITPNTIIHGDCLKIMKQIPEKSVDFVLCDLPYG